MGKMYPTFKDYLKAEYKGPWSATDVLIRHSENGKEGLVLITRKKEPYGLALPGGIAENITYAANAVKEAAEETGLHVKLDSPHKPAYVLSFPWEDPRAFISTIAYTGRGRGKLRPHPEEDARTAEIFTLEEIADRLDKPVWEKQNEEHEGWAFVHHKYILALYVQENAKNLTNRQQRIVERVCDEYHAHEHSFIREQEKSSLIQEIISQQTS